MNHPHLTVSELDESVNHTVHNLFRSNFKIPEETEILKVARGERVTNTLSWTIRKLYIGIWLKTVI